PYVLAVGGTNLGIKDDGSYRGESGWKYSGGGVSQYEPQPSYQYGFVNACSTTMRTIPDVSWLAGSNGVYIYDAFAAQGGNPLLGSQCGTSLSTPMWAGLIAIINQGRVLNGLPVLSGMQTMGKLYALPSADFHDITSGNNGSAAGPGYDLVTGLGSPNVPSLVRDMTRNVAFVDTNSPGIAEDGNSWFTAYHTLTRALRYAAGPETIYVAQGTYVPGPTLGDTFQLKNGVSIYGGYAGASDSNAARNPSLYQTILSGALDNEQHSLHVVTGSGTDSTAVLSGFTVTGGSGNIHGGGLYDIGGNPTIANCTFSGNSAGVGGGVYDQDSSPKFNNCGFSQNNAASGGGVYNNGGSPMFTNCTFSGNTAVQNAGVLDQNSSPTFNKCTFSQNSATQQGGGISDNNSSPMLTGCIFSTNTATDAGGGMYEAGSSPNLSNCNFSGNSTTNGGGLWANGGSPSLTSCTFINNSATTTANNVAPYGGGIYNDDSSLTLTDCSFSSNTANVGGGMVNTASGAAMLTYCTFTRNSGSELGGAVDNENSGNAYFIDCTFSGNSSSFGGGMRNLSCTPGLFNCLFLNNTASMSGGGMDNAAANSVLVNCTFSGNSASEGGAMSNGSSTPTAINCILWNDSASNIFPEIDSTTAAVSYSDVQGGYTGTGNINADPQFFSSTDHELSHSSPCVNVGNTMATLWMELDGGSTDRAGAPRIVGGTVDMGAYETQWIYVDQSNQTGTRDGTSWATAYSNLQSALGDATAIENNAQSYVGHPVQIQIDVAQGIYSPGSSATATFQLIDSVTIQGGYAGAVNPNAARNIVQYATVLDGSNTNYHVVTGSGTDSTAVLDGFTIAEGAANEPGLNSDGCFGGGMVINNGSPTIRNCYFNGSSAGNNSTGGGGAVYHWRGAPNFIDCVFRANSIGNTLGGAIYNQGATPSFINCTFSGNSAAYGSAICDDGSNPTLTNCILWDESGGEIYDIDASSATVQYSDVQGGYSGSNNINANPLFASNTNLQLLLGSPCINRGLDSAMAGVATDLAGNPRIVGGTVDMGAYEYQGPFVLYVDQSATGGAKTGRSWANAFTTLGPALAAATAGFTIDVAKGDYTPGSTASSTFQLISGVTIQGGYGTGGTSGPNPTLYPTFLDGGGVANSVVTGSGTDRTAVLNGFTIENGHSSGSGAGMFNNGGSPTIIDCTFSNNAAAIFGGAMANEGSSDPLLINCILRGNSAIDVGALFNQNSLPGLVNCAIYDNTATGSGGAIYNNASNTDLVNCTFTRNSAQHGGALSDADSTPDLNNCILWNDSASVSDAEINNARGTPTVNYSDVSQSGYSGNNNIDANPKFGSTTNMQLQVSSPCVNAGSHSVANFVMAFTGVNTDLAGDPRIVGGTVDMGAYECQGPTILFYAPGPTNTTVNAALPAIVVLIETNGQIARNDNATVTLSLSAGPNGAVLGGTTSVQAVQGQATFTGLSLNLPGDYHVCDGHDRCLRSRLLGPLQRHRPASAGPADPSGLRPCPAQHTHHRAVHHQSTGRGGHRTERPDHRR
ncbi:MAG: choice-of-anchor Q domain-containing protein, partial [Tepidisphaeraceae bacterium]